VQDEKVCKYCGSGWGGFPFCKCRLRGTGKSGGTGSRRDGSLSGSVRKAGTGGSGCGSTGSCDDNQWTALCGEETEKRAGESDVSGRTSSLGECSLSVKLKCMNEKGGRSGRLFL